MLIVKSTCQLLWDCSSKLQAEALLGGPDSPAALMAASHVSPGQVLRSASDAAVSEVLDGALGALKEWLPNTRATALTAMRDSPCASDQDVPAADARGWFTLISNGGTNVTIVADGHQRRSVQPIALSSDAPFVQDALSTSYMLVPEHSGPACLREH